MGTAATGGVNVDAKVCSHVFVAFVMSNLGYGMTVLGGAVCNTVENPVWSGDCAYSTSVAGWDISGDNSP